MVQIIRPEVNTQLSNASLQTSSSGAEAIGQAGLSTPANIVSGEVDKAIGQQVAIEAQRSLIQIQSEIDDSLYRKAVNEADIELARGLQARSEKSLDDNGNPTYGTLVTDSAALTDKIKGSIAAKVPSAAARLQFEQYMDRKKVGVQINAMQMARSQHLDFQRAQFLTYRDTRVENAHLATSPQERELLLGELKEGYLDQVKAGTLSQAAASKAFDEDKREVRLRDWQQRIEANPVAASQELNSQGPKELDLDVGDFDAIKAKASLAVRAQEKLQQDRVKAIETKTASLFKSAEEILESGQKLPDGLLNTLSSAPVELQPKVQTLVQKSNIMQEFSTLNESEREIQIRNLESNVKSEEELKFLSTLKAAHKNINKELETDPVAFAAKQDMFQDLPALDINSDLKSQLDARQDIRNLIHARYGVQSSGLLASEQAQLIRHINGMTPLQQSETIGQVMSSIDKRQAESLLKEINDKGAKPIALAGAHAAEGRGYIATNLLEGSTILKEKTIELPKSADLQKELEGLLPQYANLDMAKDTLLSIQALYATYAMQAGHFSSVVDKDILKRAIKESTRGGAIEYNDSSVEPPTFGMREDEFREFISSISATEIEQLGGFGDVTRDVKKVLRDANLVSAGTGQYYIYPSSEDEVRILRDKSGKLFILDYDEVVALRARAE